jgi:hypothetical protein
MHEEEPVFVIMVSVPETAITGKTLEDIIAYIKAEVDSMEDQIAMGLISYEEVGSTDPSSIN